MKWAKFLAAITPELIELGRVLYQRFKGDSGKAKGEITRIKNHGLALDAAREDIDRAFEELSQLGKEPP